MKTTTDGADNLGKIDRNILRILQKDGRISYTELARQVGYRSLPVLIALNVWSAMDTFLVTVHKSVHKSSTQP